jgi:hypothetical protein
MRVFLRWSSAAPAVAASPEKNDKIETVAVAQRLRGRREGAGRSAGRFAVCYSAKGKPALGGWAGERDIARR